MTRDTETILIPCGSGSGINKTNQLIVSTSFSFTRLRISVEMQLRFFLFSSLVAAYKTCQTSNSLQACISVSPGQNDLALKLSLDKNATDLFAFAETKPSSLLFAWLDVNNIPLGDQMNPLTVDQTGKASAIFPLDISRFWDNASEYWSVDALVHGSGVAHEYRFLLKKSDMQ